MSCAIKCNQALAHFASYSSQDSCVCDSSDSPNCDLHDAVHVADGRFEWEGPRMATAEWDRGMPTLTTRLTQSSQHVSLNPHRTSHSILTASLTFELSKIHVW